MASPTAAELETQLKNAVAMLNNYLANQTVATNIDTYIQSIESDFAQEQLAGAQIFRAQAAAVAAAARSVLGPILTAYCHHVVGVPERDPIAALDRIYTYFNDTPKQVVSRTFTFGSVSAGGSNTGSGTVRRLTADENSFDLEAAHADTKTIKCVADANTGALRHEEVFEIRGKNADVDLLPFGSGSGSGLAFRGGRVRSLSSRDSVVRNPAWQKRTVATEPAASTPYTLTANDTITDWTATDNTQIDLDIDTTYRGAPGITTPTSLVLNGNVTLTQDFNDANIALDPNTPYWYQLAWQRRSSCDGTLALRVGAQSISVDVSTGTNGVWNLLVPTLGSANWPANIVESDADIDIQLSSNTTGNVVLGPVIVAPMFPFDGLWYAIVGGATPFLLDDSFTFADSIASDSKIQKWLFLAFGRYLPHVAAATQITASGGRTLTFNNANPDTVTASSGSFVSDGYKAGMYLTVANSASNDGTYLINTVAATTITLDASESLTAEGPVSATVTLDATAHISDPA